LFETEEWKARKKGKNIRIGWRDRKNVGNIYKVVVFGTQGLELYESLMGTEGKRKKK
jgi:hypothetical protein